ncbi:ArsA family ATPase [Paraliomyxa miuraensis]|uniref:ArsA family ATPase n=1 Tax=Paraliomyxa miuraensis TaxID=376150 RepID=UPI00225151F7|nr:ArsA-related P-loop ATPase [Paraliomyxa miuraensis]MCX4241453.1 AAA family ATPase [Paraliomyxa miuraensis]
MSLTALVGRGSLVVCVGPGGVGKTTVSAALGLAAARAGRKTLVLTIDPARRLADALGLDGLDDTIRRVPLERLSQGEGEGDPSSSGGSLWAAMVDTGASYDALIERIAPDEETKARVLANRVYQAVSRSLSRSHAYVAMERLYDAIEHGGYDLVVLDTPPARNALDILDAPGHLASFLDGRVVSWFIPSADKPSGLGARLLAKGGEVATGLLARVTGQTLLDEIIAFLTVFASMREGFIARAQRVQEILRDRDTAFVLVSSASPSSADDAAWLRDDLLRRRVPVHAVVFNQSFVPVDPRAPHQLVLRLPPADVEAQVRALVRTLDPALDPALDEAEGLQVAQRMRALREEAVAENQRFGRIVDGLVAELPSECHRVRVPRLDDEVRDLPGLARLADLLLAGEQPRPPAGPSSDRP